MANAIVTQRDTQLEKQRAGYIQLSLTNFTNDDEPTIAAGSVVEISGTLYSVTTNESITEWAGISNGPAWVKLVPDGTDPFTAEYTDVAPTWSDAKQGWYDGTGTDRYVAGLTKTGASGYEDKFNMTAVERGAFYPQGIFPFSRVELITSTGSWVAPRGVYKFRASLAAGGGGGGGSTNGGGGGNTVVYFGASFALATKRVRANGSSGGTSGATATGGATQGPDTISATTEGTIWGSASSHGMSRVNTANICFGGSSFFGSRIASATPELGQGGNSAATEGGGGGGGGAIVGLFPTEPGESWVIEIGAGGAAGTGGQAGTAGAVLIEY